MGEALGALGGAGGAVAGTMTAAQMAGGGNAAKAAAQQAQAGIGSNFGGFAPKAGAGAAVTSEDIKKAYEANESTLGMLKRKYGITDEEMQSVGPPIEQYNNPYDDEYNRPGGGVA